MTTTAQGTIRIGDANYGWPFKVITPLSPYGPSVWLTTVTYDDGDRFVTVAMPEVRAAFGLTSGSPDDPQA
jgi:hypothetical protein